MSNPEERAHNKDGFGVCVPWCWCQQKLRDIEQCLMAIRREAWIVVVNNGWGQGRAAYLAKTIYDLCVDLVGKEPNDKS